MFPSSNPKPNSGPLRSGFTLIELLVVMVIIALLIGIIAPATQQVIATARQTKCLGNMREIGLAVNSYAVQRGRYPSSWQPPKIVAPGASIDGWSAFAQILPQMGEQNVSTRINFDLSYNDVAAVVTADGTTTKLSALRVPTYLCPSEENDEVRFEGGEPRNYPINYAVNLGVWEVYDPQTKRGGRGAFFPGSRLSEKDFGDGVSSTLCAAEVKAWTPYFRNAARAGVMLPPTVPSEVNLLGGDFKTNSGHTEWVDGRAHQTGFTTTFRPNTVVPHTVGGQDYDIDWTNQQEGKSNTTRTFAAVTARSYHVGLVNVVMMGGSVRSIDNDINLGVWRALSTRSGDEIFPSSFGRD